MTGSTRGIAAAAPVAVALWAATALCGATARHVEVTDDTVVEIAARVRYTTVIVVPEDERSSRSCAGQRSTGASRERRMSPCSSP